MYYQVVSVYLCQSSYHWYVCTSTTGKYRHEQNLLQVARGALNIFVKTKVHILKPNKMKSKQYSIFLETMTAK